MQLFKSPFSFWPSDKADVALSLSVSILWSSHFKVNSRNQYKLQHNSNPPVLHSKILFFEFLAQVSDLRSSSFEEASSSLVSFCFITLRCRRGCNWHLITFSAALLHLLAFLKMYLKIFLCWKIAPERGCHRNKLLIVLIYKVCDIYSNWFLRGIASHIAWHILKWESMWSSSSFGDKQ